MNREGFRAHALDGAMLYFQPARGMHVRIENAATRDLRRRAPRVAMFGITNACNLACAFCSRDVARPSAWRVDTAAAALRGLADAGTLEVAYGGGEPFAFRGFAELVEEIDATTLLAQHVTTNAALIRPAMWSRFAGRFGQVRISIYDDVDWRPAAATLAHQRWGANRIVEPAALAALPALLAELAALGCSDVSLLAYVGPERARHLDAAGDARLAAIIADSPIACRLSVCFGARIDAPRLLAGDDCGAGRDFVSITPDQRVQGCSFQDRGVPGATSDEILDAWRLHQAQLGQPAFRTGCARGLPIAAPDRAPPIAVWQAFSGNNSGECVLVARFAEVADAEAYLAALAPGWQPDAPFSPEWRALFAAESVAPFAAPDRAYGAMPVEMVSIGRSVIATQYDAEDAFPELRALAWKRGAFVVPGGVHEHGPSRVLAAIRATDAADRDRMRAASEAHARCFVHGDILLVALSFHDKAPLVEVRDALKRLAGDRPLAAELCFADDHDDRAPITSFEDAVTAALQRVGHRAPTTPRLWIRFWGAESAASAMAFARHVPGDRVRRLGSSLLIEPAPDRKRLAVQAIRRGAGISALDGALRLSAQIWYPPPPRTKGKRGVQRALDVAALEAGLRRRGLGTDFAIRPPYSYGMPGPIVSLATSTPRDAIAVLAAQAHEMGAEIQAWASPEDPIAEIVHRLLDDVRG